MISNFAPARPYSGAPEDRAINVAELGADPTCKEDATAVFANITASLPSYVVGQMSSGWDGIQDLGGLTIDLAGGCYLLSNTFLIPQFYGNIHITFGELRASATFPMDATTALVQVGAPGCNPKSGQGSCNQNVGFTGVTLDGSHRAAYSLAIHATMGATLGASSAVFGFTTAGVYLAGGHETMISDTWVAAYFWTSPYKEHNNATGILVAGNDHYVTNTIVYSAKIGVWLQGAANILNGVHTWNDATGNGGIGILNTMSQNRIQGCYLDFTDLVLQGNGAQQTAVTGGFYLGGAQLVFNASKAGDAVYGVSIANNVWYDTGSVPLAVDERAGSWTSVTDLSIEGMGLQDGQQYLGPTAAMSVAYPTGNNAVWTADFTGKLLFPSVPVAAVQARLMVAGADVAPANGPSAIVVNATDPAAPQRVVLFSAVSGNGYSMVVSVDQSTRTVAPGLV